jgi:flagellar M-ring protein FliF
MVTQQRAEDSSAPVIPAGIPGTPSTLPRPAPRPGAAGQGIQRRTENITFQTSRLVKKTKTPRGVLKKISLAILVDQGVRWEGAGPSAKRILDAPGPAKLKSIRDVVAGAVGVSAERGDQVVVETLPFEATLRIPPPAAPAPAAKPSGPGAMPGFAIPPELLKKLPKPLQDPRILALAITLILLVLTAAAVGIRMFLKKRKNKGKVKVEVTPAVEAASATPVASPVQLTEEMRGAIAAEAAETGKSAEELIAEKEAELQRLEAHERARLMLPTLSTTKSEVLVKHIAEEAKKDPAAVAQVIRTWLEEVSQA